MRLCDWGTTFVVREKGRKVNPCVKCENIGRGMRGRAETSEKQGDGKYSQKRARKFLTNNTENQRAYSAKAELVVF